MTQPVMAEIYRSNCGTEPVRFPGAIQPHGALLVLHAISGRIDAASETSTVVLGSAAQALLGLPGADVLGNADIVVLSCARGLPWSADRRDSVDAVDIHGIEFEYNDRRYLR